MEVKMTNYIYMRRVICVLLFITSCHTSHAGWFSKALKKAEEHVHWAGKRTGGERLFNELTEPITGKRTQEARQQLRAAQSQLQTEEAQLKSEQQNLNVTQTQLAEAQTAFRVFKSKIQTKATAIRSEILSANMQINKTLTLNSELNNYHHVFTKRSNELIELLEKSLTDKKNLLDSQLLAPKAKVTLKLWIHALNNSSVIDEMDIEGQEQLKMMSYLAQNNENSFLRTYQKSQEAINIAVNTEFSQQSQRHEENIQNLIRESSKMLSEEKSRLEVLLTMANQFDSEVVK